MPQKFDPKSIKLDGIHVMKNSDKTWHESWNKPRGRSMAAFPHPFTLCLLGIKIEVKRTHPTTTGENLLRFPLQLTSWNHLDKFYHSQCTKLKPTVWATKSYVKKYMYAEKMSVTF